MIKLKIYQGGLQSMKKDSKKSRKLQREKAERLTLESAKGKASPDSKRGRRIHTCPHYTLVPKAYDCEWEYTKDLSPYPWNTPTLEGPLEVPRCMGVVLPGMNAIGGTLIHVEIPMLHLKYAKFRGVMNNYIRPISDTECQCSQCHKKFPIETMEILKEMKELQAQRYKYRDLDNGLWENYEDQEIREKIEELEKKIPPVRYRKLSPIDFIYVDEE